MGCGSTGLLNQHETCRPITPLVAPIFPLYYRALIPLFEAVEGEHKGAEMGHPGTTKGADFPYKKTSKKDNFYPVTAYPNSRRKQRPLEPQA
jgi:hypothetical protein